MESHITAAKDCILQVSNYVKSTNPNIKLRIGFCGYRDHCDGIDRLKIFDFTELYEEFRVNLATVEATGGGDYPEDVLGGLDAAVTEMTWNNDTRVILHICDYPPHGRRFTSIKDNYPDGDPNGLAAEDVLEKMKSKNILYFFGKITSYTDKMIQIFRGIVGEFPVFDLVGGDPIKLIDKISKATSSSITMAVSLTSTVGSDPKNGNVYSLQQRKLDMDTNEPKWKNLPLQKGVIMWYFIPETLEELKNL